MATYQLVIELIPEKWVKINKNHAIDLLFDDTEFYDSSIAWKNCSLKIDLDSKLFDILPRRKTWHEDLHIWGDDKNNDIQIWFDNNQIDSIKIRLDLRDNIENLKENIINLAKCLHCYLLFPTEKKLLKPDIKLLNNTIFHSNAAQFVNDPETYLDEIDKNKGS